MSRNQPIEIQIILKFLYYLNADTDIRAFGLQPWILEGLCANPGSRGFRVHISTRNPKA